MSVTRSRWIHRTIPIIAVLAAACAGRGGPGAAQGAPDTRPMPVDTDERLEWALADVRAPGRLAALGALEDSLSDFDRRLARIVADTAKPPVVRANAVALLGERRAADHLVVFWTALESPDVRVRAATAGALRGIIIANEGAGLRIARRALRDPEPLVQARALEAVGDVDVVLLREYLATNPPPDVAKVAADLVRSAEERGAPLAAVSGDAPAPGTSGPNAAAKAASDDGGAYVLARTSASGVRIEFRASKRWPQWDAAVGELVVTPPGAAPVVVSAGVEVVRGVVPAFVSVDGRHIVYEAAREIRVRDLASGEERVVGPGIAPRVVPFSDWFVFLREDPGAREESREHTTVGYAVMRGSFTDEAVEKIGTVRATLSMGEHGFYSPARWMRVRERDGVFTLEAESLESFRLPDPFAAVDAGT